MSAGPRSGAPAAPPSAADGPASDEPASLLRTVAAYPTDSQTVTDTRNVRPELLAALAFAALLLLIALAITARVRGVALPAAWGIPTPPASAAALLLLAALLAPALMAEAANTVAMFKTPSSGNLFVGGDSLLVQEEVALVGAPGLGSFEFGVDFNASILTVAVQEGPFLSSTGNPTACTTTYLSLGQLRFSCAVVGTPTAGPEGRGVIAILEVRPRTSLNLRPTRSNGLVALLDDITASVVLKDVKGTPISLATVGDAIVVVRALEGDLNRDCKVNVVDDQMIAARYLAIFGMLAYDPWFDLEPSSTDGDIDIKDLQFVFGRNGSTCVAPIPSQTPPPGQTPTIPPTSTSTPTPTPTGTSTKTPTRTSTPTPTSTARTPIARATETPRPASPTTTGTPTGTPTLFSTVLPITITSVPTLTVPPELPPSGLTGPSDTWVAARRWTAVSLTLTALGFALALAATRHRWLRKDRR